ncbi:unnamed protein product [Schistosoma haematobium]|nr:unnamed protein product [Schistosoma haematobium]
MVVFVCSQCNATLKKSNVRNHLQFSRRCSLVSCVDCHKDFDKFSVESHCLCISEKEKYDKANYLKSSKSNNISKQAEWVKRIEDAIQNCESQRHKSILQNIRGNCNVPQKKKKFENFMRSKYRKIPEETIEDIWKLLEPLKRGTFSTVPLKPQKDLSSDLTNDEPTIKKRKLEDTSETLNNYSSENECHLLSLHHIQNVLAELGGKAPFSSLRKQIYSTYKTSVLSPQECMTKKEFKAKLLGVIQDSGYFIFSPSDGMISVVSDDLVTRTDLCVNPDPDTSIITCQNGKPHYSESIKKLLITTINDAGGQISLKKLVKRVSSRILNPNDQKEVSLTKEEVESKIVRKVNKSQSMKLSDDGKRVELCS